MQVEVQADSRAGSTGASGRSDPGGAVRARAHCRAFRRAARQLARRTPIIPLQ